MNEIMVQMMKKLELLVYIIICIMTSTCIKNSLKFINILLRTSLFITSRNTAETLLPLVIYIFNSIMK